MFAPATNRPCAALSLALIAASLGAAAPGSAVGQIQSSVSGLHYGTSAAAELACNAGKPAGTKDSWVEANGAAVESGELRRMSLSFGDPIATDTFRAAMNDVGARDLALVEVQDADGGWRKVWEGRLSAPAPGFSQSCFEQKLAQKQVVRALRFTFRAAPGDIKVDHAALLRR